MDELTYDPKLRVAMKEIDDVLAKHDIGALVALQSRSHTEFKMAIEPTWSLVRYIRKGEAVHIKLHHSKQPQLDQTTAMIFNFRDMAALFFSQMDFIAKKVEQHAKVDHKPFGPHGISNDDRGDQP